LDGFAAAYPESLHILGRDNGAGPKAVRWPSNVVPVFLLPYSPEFNPIERLRRDLKDQLADFSAQTLDALSEVVCSIIHHYIPATLQSLTSFADFVRAVDTAQKALYV